MIDRQHGKITLVCDNCDTTYDEYPSDDFREMIGDAKAAKWVIEKDENGDWVHWCPDCH